MGEATKRRILAKAGKIFDPLNFLIPVTILNRVFLQKLWKLNYDWDVLLNDELQLERGEIVNKIKAVCTITVSRWIIHTETVTLHLFSDASKIIYGCCAYNRPVTNISLLGKIIECAANVQLYDHLVMVFAIPNNQSAYRKKTIPLT